MVFSKYQKQRDALLKKKSKQPRFAISKQTMLTLSDFGLQILSGITHVAVAKLGAQSLLGLLRFLVLHDETLLKEALSSRALTILGGALISHYLLSNLRNAIVNHISSLSEEYFIDKMIEWEGETHSISIWNSRNPGKSIDIRKTAQAYALHMSMILYDNPFFYTSITIAASTYMAQNPALRYLVASVGLLQFITMASSYLFRKDAIEKQANSANLTDFIAKLGKADYSQIGVYSLIPALYRKLQSHAYSASSLYKFHNIFSGVMDLTLGFIRKASEVTPLIFSIYLGIDTFAYQLSYSLVNRFSLIKEYTVDYVAPIIEFRTVLESLHQLKPKFTKFNTRYFNTGYFPISFSEDSIIKLPNGTNQAVIRSGTTVDYYEVTLIKGPSGCGKTTLVNIMTGHSDLLDEDSLRAELDDKDVCSVPALSYAILPKTTWLEFITGMPEANTSNFDKLVELKEILQSLKLDSFIEKLDNDMEQPSSGEFKRMIVARAIFNKAKLIVLDETFSSVSNEKGATFDEQTDRDAFLKLIKTYATNNRAAIVCISHDDLMYTENGKKVPFADSVIEFKEYDKKIAGNYNKIIRIIKAGLMIILKPHEKAVLEILKSDEMMELVNKSRLGNNPNLELFIENVNLSGTDDKVEEVKKKFRNYFEKLIEKLDEKGIDKDKLKADYAKFEQSLPEPVFPLFEAKQEKVRARPKSDTEINAYPQ